MVNQSECVTLLVVDDHALFLEGLRLLLDRRAGEFRVHEAGSGAAASVFLERTDDLDLVLLDWHLPDLDAAQYIRAMAAADPPVPVIVVSATEEVANIAKALDAGALGFVPKSESSTRLLGAIRHVLDGHVHLSSELGRAVSAWRRGRDGPSLSPRQEEILGMLAEGLSNRQIAQRLDIREATVKTHVTALLNLVGADNRTSCVHLARERGLLP